MNGLVMVAGYITTIWLSWHLTRQFVLFALERRLVDVPNERSSHCRVTPRGGGIAFVIPFLAAVAIVGLMRELPVRSVLGLAAGSGMALIGYLDDRRGLSIKLRFIAQLTLTSITLALIVGSRIDHLRDSAVITAVGFITCVILYTWLINLVNFMDGIDGLAASGAVCVCATCSLLISLRHGVHPLGFLFGLLACAAIGFLYWNWPSAHIFMGDAGSYFLGFIIGALMMQGVVHHDLSLFVIPIMLGVFVVDSSLTTVTRMLRRESWYKPHRLFAFHHAADAFGHRAVTSFVIVIHLLWLAPIAFVADFFPLYGLRLLLLAWSPLVVLAYLFHSGEVLMKDGMPRWRTMLLIIGWHGNAGHGSFLKSLGQLGPGRMCLIRACLITLISMASIAVAMSGRMGGLDRPLSTGVIFLLVIFFISHNAVLLAFGGHRWHWHLLSLQDLPDIAGVCLVSTFTGVVGAMIVDRVELLKFHAHFFVIETVVLIALIVLLRMIAAALSPHDRGSRGGGTPKRVIIYGANGLGLEIVSNLRRLGSGYRITGFVDPRSSMKGIAIAGIRVLGVDSEIEKLVSTYHVDEVLVSSALAHSAAGRRFLEHCRDAAVGIREIPSLEYSLAVNAEPNPMQA